MWLLNSGCTGAGRLQCIQVRFWSEICLLRWPFEAQAELNGQAGKVIAYVPERGLYKVQFAAGEAHVKEQNLALPHPEWRHN